MYDELGPDGRRKHTVQQIADEFGVTRPTIYRHLQRPLAEHQLTGRHARRGDVELRGDVLDDLAWDVTEISAERTDEADGRQLHGEAQPVVIATTTTDKTQIIVVEEEEALQLQPRRHADEPAVRAGLGIGEELDRYAGSTYRPASSSA